MSNNGLIPPTPVPSPYSSGAYAVPAVGVTNTLVTGTVPPLATNYNNDGCYFVKKGEAVEGPLISTVEIFSSDLSKMGIIDIDSAQGYMTLGTGANPSTGGAPALGLTLNSGPTGIIATIGDITIPKQPSLFLSGQVATVPTTSQVFDEVFNPPTGVQLVNITGPIVSANYPNGWLTDSPNDGTIITTFTGGTSGSFNVPVSGLYMFQVSIMMAPETVSTGGSAGGAFSLQVTVNIASAPFDPVGGVVIGQGIPLSSEDTVSYYCWNAYIPFVAGQLYNLTWRMLAGGGVYLPPNLINNIPYSDLKVQLIKIG
jgi:hypothetical protein